MISAPVRPTEVGATKIQIAETVFQETVLAEPHIQTHGHLALVNWTLPATFTAPAKPLTLKDPVCKSATDRWFERGIFLLMASSAAAIGACFLHL
jgi:hypothetical protein